MKLPNINWGIVTSVVVGLCAFGAGIYLIKKLPRGNVITDAVRKVPDVVVPDN